MSFFSHYEFSLELYQFSISGQYLVSISQYLTEGSMLGRRGWFDAMTKKFDAGKKGMV